MKMFEVVFKNGAVRRYASEFNCEVDDVVVADTSHGPMLATVTKEINELPAILDTKIRYLLCRVPVENSAKVIAERKDQRLARMKELDAAMDALMKEKEKTIMRLVFADYCDDFCNMLDEYEALQIVEKNEKPESVNDESGAGEEDDQSSVTNTED